MKDLGKRCIMGVFIASSVLAYNPCYADGSSKIGQIKKYLSETFKIGLLNSERNKELIKRKENIMKQEKKNDKAPPIPHPIFTIYW